MCRKVAIINLDPANDALPYPFSLYFLWLRCLFCLDYVDLKFAFFDANYSYECAVNIEELIKLSDVMAEHSLGPNGGC